MGNLRFVIIWGEPLPTPEEFARKLAAEAAVKMRAAVRRACRPRRRARRK